MPGKSMSTTFWYHPESDSFYTMDHDPQGDQGDGMSVELTEQEWVDKQIELALENKRLPEGCTAILVEASKTLSFGSGKPVLHGKIYMRDGIPNGTECTTTPIVEEMVGNRFRTRNSTYLVQFAKR